MVAVPASTTPKSDLIPAATAIAVNASTQQPALANALAEDVSGSDKASAHALLASWTITLEHKTTRHYSVYRSCRTVTTPRGSWVECQ